MLAVYVDDFVLAAVENQQQTLFDHMMHLTLHANHSVFPVPSADNPQGTKDSISEKNLQKGDAHDWDPIKAVLGYELNGRACAPYSMSGCHRVKQCTSSGMDNTHGDSSLLSNCLLSSTPRLGNAPASDPVSPTSNITQCPSQYGIPKYCQLVHCF
jgi:hypothetical protein